VLLLNGIGDEGQNKGMGGRRGKGSGGKNLRPYGNKIYEKPF